jgi:hypothetical protein
MSNDIKIDQIVGGNNSIRTDYIEFDAYEDPITLVSNVGTTYVKEVDGYSELHYYDDYSNVVQITDKGSIVSETSDGYTTGDISYYADGSSGSDSNDGLTSGSPKKTLQAVFNLIPYHVWHKVNVVLTGIFSSNTAILSNNIKDGYYINIDGYESLTTVAGPYTVTNAGASSIESTTTVTDDIYSGYMVNMTSGSYDGYVRSICYNESDTFYYCKQDNVGDNGDTFNIVKPETTLSSSSSIEIACSGAGSVIVRKLHLNDGTKIWSEGCDADIILYMLTADDSTNGPAYSFENCNKVEFSEQSSLIDSTEDITAGVTVVGGSFNTMTYLNNITDVSMDSVVLSKVKISNCGIGLIKKGSVFRSGIIINNSKSIILSRDSSPDGFYSFENTASYANTRISRFYSGSNDYSTIGLLIINSNIGVKELDIDDSGSHGINLIHSNLLVIVTSSIITGSNNTGAGVFTQCGSTVITAGSYLTITGDLGEYRSRGGSSETWVNVQNSASPTTYTPQLSLAFDIS